MKTIGNFTLFFTANDPFSNWYAREFIIKGVRFSCMEQFMMYAKAKLFQDEITAQKILKAQTPSEHKRLGRLVKGYQDEIWNARRERIVRAGAYEKFRQHADLCGLLLSTGTTVLVEASPYDKIWGAGVSENDPRILDPSKWPGKNLLGGVLMAVRAQLAAERATGGSNSVE